MRKFDIKLSKEVHLCENKQCLNIAAHHHHKFSDTNWARKVYGRLLDDDFNIALLCAHCNSSHANVKDLRYDEQQFREAAKDAGYTLPDSKVVKNKRLIA